MYRIAFATFLMVFALVAKAATTPTEFTGEALALKQKMESLFEASKKVNVPPDTKGKFRGEIETSLDWDKIAQSSLEGNTGKGTAAQRQQFRNLLKEVAVKTAYSRMDTFWDGVEFNFDKIDVKGNEALVQSSFKKKNENFELEYYLHKKGGSWIIYDIAFRKERYSVNIREQISEFLSQGNFATLLDKLKKRRDELDRGNAPKKT